MGLDHDQLFKLLRSNQRNIVPIMTVIPSSMTFYLFPIPLHTTQLEEQIQQDTTDNCSHLHVYSSSQSFWNSFYHHLIKIEGTRWQIIHLTIFQTDKIPAVMFLVLCCGRSKLYTATQNVGLSAMFNCLAFSHSTACVCVCVCGGGESANRIA